MKISKFLVLSLVCLLWSNTSIAAPKNFTLKSPSTALRVEINLADQITFKLLDDDVALIAPSPISVTLGDGRVAGYKARLSGSTKRSIDTQIATPIYRKSQINDKFNELTLRFKGYNLIFRAYDSGMAYRFEFTDNKPFTITAEQASFTFPQDSKAFICYVRPDNGTQRDQQFWNSFENKYSVEPLSAWQDGRLAFLPLLVEAKGGRKLCITESDLLNYPGMYLYPQTDKMTLNGVYAPYPNQVKVGGHNMLEQIVTSTKDYIAHFEGAAQLPWRIVAVSREDVELADNDLVYSLASPSEGDFSWVKPGKVAWEWWNDWNIHGVDFKSGINNKTYKYYIDFASNQGIEYVILDEGWAKHNVGDLMQVVPQINMKMLVDYATSKNVGIILWSGYYSFNRDMENVCRHYSQMGVKGFKIDFMNRDDQVMVDFHTRAAQMGAKYKMLIDFHGTYKPTGINRTYPNVINFEAVDGLEQLKWAANTDQVTYDVTIPFIRQLAGPMDYTQGAMRNASKSTFRAINSEPMSQGTRCRQLAEYVIFESPLNMLCDTPTNYMKEQECLNFITAIPTVWDQTKVLSGKVGEYIVTARRSCDVWYVGGLTDWSEREMDIDLSSLNLAGRNLDLYIDGMNASRAACDYKKITTTIPANGIIKIKMASGGGFAMQIKK